jgi:ATP-binding cassette, subfamily F, member 2
VNEAIVLRRVDSLCVCVAAVVIVPFFVWCSTDMESIDALALAINEFKGGLVLVSHDMRLIGQVAKEIWICDNKTISKHKGDIQSFKMDMRAQMGLSGEQVGKLRGDASTVKQESKPVAAAGKPKSPLVQPPKKKPPTVEVIQPSPPKVVVAATPAREDDDVPTTTTVSTVDSSGSSAPTKYIPPHLRRKVAPPNGALE